MTAPISRESLNKAYDQMSMVWNPGGFEGMAALQAKAAAKADQLYEAYLWLVGLSDDEFPYCIDDGGAASAHELSQRTLPLQGKKLTLPPPPPSKVTKWSLYDGRPDGMLDLAAPFMRRAGAWMIDMGLGLFVWMAVLFVMEYRAVQEVAATGKDVPTTLIMTTSSWLMVAFCFGLYQVLLECSGLQASLGKKMLGLVVTDKQGGRVSFGWEALRIVGMLVSACFPPLYLACLWTHNRQCLHDILAGCQVMWRLPYETAQEVAEKEAAKQVSMPQIAGMIGSLLMAGVWQMVKENQKHTRNYQAPYVAPVPQPPSKDSPQTVKQPPVPIPAEPKAP